MHIARLYTIQIFKAYNGLAFSADYSSHDGNQKEIEYHVKGRVIIDTKAYNMFHSGPIEIDSEIDEELVDAQYLIATLTVYGYFPKGKKWLSFQVDDLTDIEWKEQPLESLILPQQQGLKDVILAIANTQSNKLNVFDDFIGRKGRTDLAHAPNVEANLTAITDMARKLGTIVLFDRADVFMEVSYKPSPARDEMVAIFLMMLDYEATEYTLSNSTEDVESRIHRYLGFGTPDAEISRQIWIQFLRRLSSLASFTDEEIDQLVRNQLNGRRTRDVAKAAGLLARSKGTPAKDVLVRHGG
ncbi:hypothetical protein N7457_007104 [Penicillium paradoxum]|uniref:uncharacterized protein n=1 Tax=Penicillium paradoxum TaxID=176176 RepID=UPI0025478922|nr:uncharacterized protein N7457_007104 [Penicillium paradoxum]KAJ5779384.1 hypothetical protein N7457_007104 [Penicillium paradoxum]